MKDTKRKGFNFFRSYYDVYNELSKNDKVLFIDALLDRQFLGIEPKNLKGKSKLAYISQINSIDAQVKGYNDKQKHLKRPLLGENHTHPTAPPAYGGSAPPAAQVEEKEKVEEKEEVKEQVELTIYPSFEDFWKLYDKKVGDVNKIKKKFEKLSQDVKEKIMDHIVHYKKSNPDKKFRKNPETYLNNKSWNDEIIYNGTIKKESEFKSAIRDTEFYKSI